MSRKHTPHMGDLVTYQGKYYIVKKIDSENATLSDKNGDFLIRVERFQPYGGFWKVK